MQRVVLNPDSCSSGWEFQEQIGGKLVTSLIYVLWLLHTCQ